MILSASKNSTTVFEMNDRDTVSCDLKERAKSGELTGQRFTSNVDEIGRAHVRTPVTSLSRMPSSA